MGYNISEQINATELIKIKLFDVIVGHEIRLVMLFLFDISFEGKKN